VGRGPALPSFLAALGVEIERKRAGGRVEVTFGIAGKRERPNGRVFLGHVVLRERIGTNGRVVFAGSVLLERSGTNGILWRFSAVPASPLPARRSSMSVILLEIRDQTGEAIFPATLLGKFTR
jgi:hypothetical protein